MKQKRLYRTIETVASKKFNSNNELLIEVVEQLLKNAEINITGGRVWKLDIERQGYSLIYQTGNVQKIELDFLLPILEYPVLDLISIERTILANETNKILQKKGIFKYSASGVGQRQKINGKSYYEYLIAVNSDNIDDELRYTLNIVATVLTQKINERRLYDSRKNLIEDIDKAKELQRSILPDHELTFHGYELFGVTIPAQTLGGDFFDYLRIGDDESRLGIAVGDAASKGLSAAAEAMYISGALRMACTFQIKISPLFNRMNELINKIFSDDRFTSLFYAEISNDKKGLCLYANGGHNPPMLIRAKNKEIIYLDPTGPLLGPAPHSKYDTDSINFNKGDLLVIYTDGIVESANEKFELYEEKRLENVLKKNINLSPRELCYSILDDVNTFSTSNSQYQDDKTIVVIKRKD
ncbi:MAG TPA: PP2C family protein-serine/threonine phosphatase [Melioribacteraceae bacterium]|nr:PP2C family protein-serine/threonine phosphatase [Melioribacteraceae bacterium]